jgi:teichuronic acid biosynthesis glycosyltransferase TuaC
LRLVFFSLSYPTPWQPTAAAFNRAMVEALSAEHEVRVVAPVPWTQRFRSVPGRRGEVLHPLYLFPPKILREHYGTFLWSSCRRTLRRLTARFDPDAFLAYWAHPDGEVALRAAREAGRPGVVIVGGSDVLVLGGQRRRREAIRHVLQAADAVLTVGHTLRDRVVGLGVPAQRVTAFHRGVDTTVFCPGDAWEARARLGLPADPRMALWVGRMVPVKGLDVLLEAWHFLASSLREARLCLVGDGPRMASLRRQADRLGLGSSVSFVGSRPHAQLAEWYRAADVTVLPSLSEGVPNVLLESLACGTPFVASDVGGVREIEAESWRYLVPSGQPAPLAEALERRLRERGRASLPPGHTLTESAAAITRVLERVVAERQPQPSRALC